MYNRLRKAASAPNAGAADFTAVHVPPVMPSQMTSRQATMGRRKGKGRKAEDPERSKTFARLYKDHERISKTRTRQRQMKDEAEAKYLEKKSFRVTGKSTSMINRGGKAASTSVGERLHEPLDKKQSHDRLSTCAIMQVCEHTHPLNSTQENDCKESGVGGKARSLALSQVQIWRPK